MDYHNFEDEIHFVVLDLGKTYFEKGKVAGLEKTDAGWKAKVEGSQTYDVSLNGTEGIDATICNCPYDHGPECKHIAATLYAVRASVFEELKEGIDAMSEEEMRKMITEQVQNSRRFAGVVRGEVSR